MDKLGSENCHSRKDALWYRTAMVACKVRSPKLQTVLTSDALPAPISDSIPTVVTGGGLSGMTFIDPESWCEEECETRKQ